VIIHCDCALPVGEVWHPPVEIQHFRLGLGGREVTPQPLLIIREVTLRDYLEAHPDDVFAAEAPLYHYDHFYEVSTD